MLIIASLDEIKNMPSQRSNTAAIEAASLERKSLRTNR
jgi:hypothetical protein